MAIDSLWLDLIQMQEFAKDPLVMTRGDGVRIWDEQGRCFLEGISGVFVNSLGHGNRRVIEAAAKQLERLAFCGPTTTTSDRMIELGERLLGLAGPGISTVKFHTGGSEATEAAIKIARQFHRQNGEPGRFKVIARYGAYHGATFGALSATGIAHFRERFEPLLGGFVHVAAPPATWTPEHEGDDPWLDALRDTIIHEGPGSIAVVLLEPVMNMAGVVEPQPGHLARVRALCDEFGILLAYDEIVTGFGRLGAWFAADRYQAWPHLLCVGKGMSSGYAPISAVLIDERVAAAFRDAGGAPVQFMSGHTFGGNPVACAVALAVIDEIDQRGLLAHAQRMGQRFHEAFAAPALAGRVRAVRAPGLLIAVDVRLDDAERAEVTRSIRRSGLLLLGPTPAGTIRLAPPLVVTEDDVDEMAGIVTGAIAQLDR